MRSRIPTGLVLAVVLAHPAGGAATLSRADPEQIRALAERYVTGLGPPGGVVHAAAVRLDPRLALPACAGELTPSLPPGAGIRPRVAVTVRCGDTGGWSLVVPVDVATDLAVLVARRPLNRGEMPAAADLEVATRRLPGIGTQYVTRMADTEGRRLRHPLGAGQPLTADALAAPVLVERGQQVTLVAEAAGISIRAGGVALDAGGHGDRVRARSLSSGRIVEGVVEADGTLATRP